MAKKDERFIKVLDEGSAFGWQRTIFVDRQTGVNYLWISLRLRRRPDPAAQRRRPPGRHRDPDRGRITPQANRRCRPDSPACTFSIWRTKSCPRNVGWGKLAEG